MKRRSLGKRSRTRGSYSRKLMSPGAMMYGPTRHRDTHPPIGEPIKHKPIYHPPTFHEEEHASIVERRRGMRRMH